MLDLNHCDQIIRQELLIFQVRCLDWLLRLHRPFVCPGICQKLSQPPFDGIIGKGQVPVKRMECDAISAFLNLSLCVKFHHVALILIDKVIHIICHSAEFLSKFLIIFPVIFFPHLHEKLCHCRSSFFNAEGCSPNPRPDPSKSEDSRLK